MGDDWIRLCKPIFSAEVEQRLAEVLRSGYLVQGPHVAAFEQAVAERLGVRHAVAVNSGTSALHLAFLAAGLGPSARVLMTDFTFPSPASVLEMVGAQPVFVDIAPDGYNMDLDQAERICEGRADLTAIVAIHQFGECLDMERVMKLADRRGLTVIEDAACAIGVTCGGRSAGAFGRMGCLSFHPRKVLSTGEGGMIVTDDDATAERLRRLRNHGLARTFDEDLDVLEPGLNLRLPEMQAILGLEQIRRVDELLTHRQAVARVYHERLTGVPGLTLPGAPWPGGHNFQSYVVRLPDGVFRNQVVARLREHRIESTLGTYAVHRLGYFRRKYGLSDVALPRATRAWRQCLSLPIGDHVTGAEADRVADALIEALAVR
mgnify:CR=1 FL=1